MGLRARVQKGRLKLDEPTGLPDGTVIDLALDDEGDDLSISERRQLEAHLQESWTAARRGSVRPAAQILHELRTRR